jgi:hypothetical protein
MDDQESLGPRTWAGMNLRQIGLLGGMAIVTCLVICVGTLLLIGPIASSLSGSDGSVAAEEPPTETPTEVPPTRTPTITKTPVGGWKEFLGSGMAIQLPSSYIGGDPAAESERIKNELSLAGLEMAKLDSLFTHLPPYRFVALEIANDKSAPATVVIASDPGNPSTPLDVYINLVLQRNVDAFYFLDRTAVWLDNYSAVRFTVESKTDRSVRQYEYFLQDESGNYWVIVYSAPIARFPNHISDFELSVTTFHAIAEVQTAQDG